MPLLSRAAFIYVAALALGTMAHAADPSADLAKFSVFEGFDLGKVGGGKVLSARGPTLGSPRDLAVQAVYVVNAPLSKVVTLHRQWDPTRHSGQKVVLHHDFSGKPDAGDFTKLMAVPGSGAVKSLAAATQKLPERGDLQLSSAEAAEYNKGATGSAGAWPSSVGEFWSKVLLSRAQAFASRGLGGQPPYEGKQALRVADEASRLLQEQPKLKAQFSGLIGSTPLGGGTGSLPAQMYWEIFDEESQGAVSLGAFYARESGDTAQMADLQYYASGGYYAYVTLYQLWSITIDGKPATLVWRGDSIASQALSELRGVEKMGSGAAMMKEVQKSIAFFQKDAGR
jgi:hypothetical protein